MKLVVDASPVILLNSVGQLDLLPALAREIVVPAAVFQELEKGAALDDTAARLQGTPWATTAEAIAVPSHLAAWDLGAGETAALAWGVQHPGFMVLADDRAARTCARILELPLIGTLGLIIAAKEGGLLPAARPVVENLLEAGFYIGRRIVEEALRMVGE